MTDNNPVQIKIDPIDENSDTLVIRLDRQVSATPLYVSSPEEAQTHALAQELMSMGILEAVLLQDQAITLLKPVGDVQWAVVVQKAGPMIERYFDVLEAAKGDGPDRPDMTPEEKELAYKVQELLNNDLNPMVATHGGFIEVLAVKQTTLFVHMGGGCQGCAMSTATLKQGVEQVVMEAFPELTEILDSTDHAAGKNPYYAQ